jgi:hypothetical protein
MNIRPEFAGLIGLCSINIVFIAVAWGRITEKLDSLNATSDARLIRIEKQLGIADGVSSFIRRAECPVMDHAFRTEVAKISERLSVLENEVSAIRRCVNGENK